MNVPDQWRQEHVLIDYLARQLIRGRLGIFLGAGISRDYDLPDWKELVARLCICNDEKPPTANEDLILKGGYLRAKYYPKKSDEPKFKQDLKKALYQDIILDFAKLRQNDTLSAIGSLVMSSKRGSAAKVFTLNYDDLLENYLEFHGFTTTTIWSEIHWAENEDVVIYHPHGFLPLAPREDSDNVILGSADYHEIMQSDIWRPLLDTALRTHTFLYIGLSGADLHLQSLLAGMRDRHAIASERTCYHGVRFFSTADGRDEVGVILEKEGLFTHQLTDFSELPSFLFKICQVAGSLRMSSH